MWHIYDAILCEMPEDKLMSVRLANQILRPVGFLPLLSIFVQVSEAVFQLYSS
jgi:hypothetical protein